MFNPTKSKVKWYKRKSGTYAKQINLNVDCQFTDGEIVYVLNQKEFKEYCNPDLYDENVELKEQLQKLQDEFDAFKLDSDSMKQQLQSHDETILNGLRQDLEDARNKSEKLQSDINQMHQNHADEVKGLNQKIQDMNDKMQDVSNLNTFIMQDVNRKNIELKDYQTEVETSIGKAVKETDKMANAKLKEISKWDFLFHKDKISLNIQNDELENIIADNTPARKQGFLEVITAPQITNGDGDVGNNQETNDEK